jgi:hypothetical protein
MDGAEQAAGRSPPSPLFHRLSEPVLADAQLAGAAHGLAVGEAVGEWASGSKAPLDPESAFLGCVILGSSPTSRVAEAGR